MLYCIISNSNYSSSDRHRVWKEIEVDNFLLVQFYWKSPINTFSITVMID
jgi:hypothetical protein